MKNERLTGRSQRVRFIISFWIICLAGHTRMLPAEPPHECAFHHTLDRGTASGCNPPKESPRQAAWPPAPATQEEADPDPQPVSPPSANSTRRQITPSISWIQIHLRTFDVNSVCLRPSMASIFGTAMSQGEAPTPPPSLPSSSPLGVQFPGSHCAIRTTSIFAQAANQRLSIRAMRYQVSKNLSNPYWSVCLPL